MEKYQLKSIDEIFSETWRLYKKRSLPILLLSLLSVLVTVTVLVGGGAAAFVALGGQPYFSGELREILLDPAVVGAGVALSFAAALLLTWCQTTVLTVTVRQEINGLGGLVTSWKYVFPLLWISSLYVGIITAGTLFFLLPGLILAFSMSLCFVIMVAEERTGIDALLASRLYMRGHWWNTLFKLVPVWVLSVLIGLIPEVGPILSLLFMPFTMLYTVTVYRDLKECSGGAAPSTGFGSCWVLFGVFGFFLPVLAVIGFIIALGPKLPDFIKKIQTEVQLKVNETLDADIFPRTQTAPEKSMDKKEIKPPVVHQLPSVNGFLVWRDPIGDTYTPFLDIKDVSAKGEQGELMLTVTMTRPLSDYFLTVEQETVDLLISFYLDTDTNSATGGSPFGHEQERNGYDTEVQVQLVSRQEEATTPVSGGVKVSLYRMNGEERRSFGHPDTVPVTVSGDTVTVRLPYSQLKVSPGDTLRMCYREAAQEQGQRLAEDKPVPLK